MTTDVDQIGPRAQWIVECGPNQPEQIHTSFTAKASVSSTVTYVIYWLLATVVIGSI